MEHHRRLIEDILTLAKVSGFRRDQMRDRLESLSTEELEGILNTMEVKR